MESCAAGSRRDLALAWAWAAALFALTVWLGRLDLLDPDETRHAEIAREMLAGGHWLLPILHGEPYYQKPAAYYWLLAGSMWLFGENAAAARAPSVLAALWTIFATAKFARRAYSPRTAALTVAGLATTLAFVGVARTVVVDLPFTAALTSAFVWLGLWLLDPALERRSIWLFYVAIAIAVLLKGPAALVLAAMMVVALLVTTRDITLLGAMKPVAGTLLVAALALPWYVAAWHRAPESMRELLLHHNVERYLRPIGAGHVEPWYYYFVALPVGLLPWTPIIAAALGSRLSAGRRTPADQYCALWAGVAVVFFLPAATKILTYVLPAFPPLLCMGAAWASAQAQGSRRWLAPYAATWTFVVLLASGAACAYVAYTTARVSPAGVLLLPVAAFATALGLRRASRPDLHLTATAAGSLALTVVVYGTVANAVNAFRDSRAGGALLQSGVAEVAELVSYRCTPHAIAFYARKAAVRTRDPRRALRALEGTPPGALLTERKRLAELGLDPMPGDIRVAWRNAAGLMLLVSSREPAARESAGSGGEGRESNPPPTVEAGVTVLKTGRTTGPDPSPQQ